MQMTSKYSPLKLPHASLSKGNESCPSSRQDPNSPFDVMVSSLCFRRGDRTVAHAVHLPGGHDLPAGDRPATEPHRREPARAGLVRGGSGPVRFVGQRYIETKFAQSLYHDDIPDTEWPIFGSAFVLVTAEDLQKEGQIDPRGELSARPSKRRRRLSPPR